MGTLRDRRGNGGVRKPRVVSKQASPFGCVQERAFHYCPSFHELIVTKQCCVQVVIGRQHPGSDGLRAVCLLDSGLGV